MARPACCTISSIDDISNLLVALAVAHEILTRCIDGFSFRDAGRAETLAHDDARTSATLRLVSREDLS